MRMVVLATIAVSAGLFAATSSANAAAYTFTTIDVPGALGSSGAAGINNAGQIVGGFADHAGPHGYLDTGGSFTTIDVPGASSTEALGISNAGQIVGDTQNRGGSPFASPFGPRLLLLGRRLYGHRRARCTWHVRPRYQRRRTDRRDFSHQQQ